MLGPGRGPPEALRITSRSHAPKAWEGYLPAIRPPPGIMVDSAPPPHRSFPGTNGRDGSFRLTPGIKYVAPLPPGGYAEAARRALLGLERAGVSATFMPLVDGPGLGLALEPYRGRTLADPELAGQPAFAAFLAAANRGPDRA